MKCFLALSRNTSKFAFFHVYATFSNELELLDLLQMYFASNCEDIALQTLENHWY